MNDDPPASPPADRSLLQDAYLIADADTFPWEDSDPNNVDWQERRRLRSRIQKSKKVELLDDLVRTLDITIFCELSILYYMDCSLIRFLLRALVEWAYFTPKPKIFPDPPENRPCIGAILGTNVICLLFHIFSARPEAGEATRGYLHGGLLIDFVGQKGPVSKTRLVLLDLMTLVLQLLMLAAFLARQELRSVPTSPTTAAADPSSTTVPTPPDAQDHDFEERAVLRSDLPHVSDNSIELQPLHHHHQLPSAGRTGGEEDGERDELLAAHCEAHDTRENPPTNQHHPLDVFHSGGHIVADLRIVDTVREQWMRYRGGGGSTAASASASASGTAAVAAFLRGIGWVFGRFGSTAF